MSPAGARVGTEVQRDLAEVVCAAQGAGPLLERDYSAVIDRATCQPEQIGYMIRARFEEFAPPETAVFERSRRGRKGKDKGKSREVVKKPPLEVGDELVIRIALRGRCKVRVVHTDERSLTLRTLKGHPEAGRITFGAGRDDRGRLTFRILSRTRASGLLNYLGYLVLGKQLQSRCWIRFIERVAEACGGTIVEPIRVRTRKVCECAEDRPESDAPPSRAPPLPRPRGFEAMSRWRFGHGWSEDELRDYLAELRDRPVNFDEPLESMTRENGWTIDGDHASIGREPEGPPVHDGLFVRARQAIIHYDFSDPRIVVGHFDPDAPLVGRDMLLELKVMGLHFLGGVRVREVRDEVEHGTTLFGFRYDTLAGHIERGFEWFLLAKDHATGDISFRIEAHWRPGVFPTWWSKLGFELLGEHYRTVWRHRAPDRIRRLALQPARVPLHQPGGLAHRGDEALQRSRTVEEEEASTAP